VRRTQALGEVAIGGQVGAGLKLIVPHTGAALSIVAVVPGGRAVAVLRRIYAQMRQQRRGAGPTGVGDLLQGDSRDGVPENALLAGDIRRKKNVVAVVTDPSKRTC
jgi:hypothetical protein